MGWTAKRRAAKRAGRLVLEYAGGNDKDHYTGQDMEDKIG